MNDVLTIGYSERAYACWQAMIELVFFVPDHLHQQTFYDRVKALEFFWEAEWPRFGEDVCETLFKIYVLQNLVNLFYF